MPTADEFLGPPKAEDFLGPAPRARQQQPGMGAAAGAGFMHGLGNLLYGGAQIGARMQEPTGFAPIDETLVPRVDQAVRQRQQAYEANPAVRAHPIAAGAGEIGGALASTAPLAAIPGVGAALAAPSTALGRIGLGTGIGAAQGALQPTAGRNLGMERLKGTGIGAAGGVAGGALGEVVGSTLGKAIAGNSPQAVDNFVTGKFRNVVKPSRIGQQTAPQLAAQDSRILTAVDQIIANQPNLKFTNEIGQEVTGQLPRSLRQFSEAIDQTKRSIFQRYDQMAQQAGTAGVRVDLTPVVQKLREAAAQPEVIDLHPNLAADAERLATNFEARGFYTPGEAQDVIQNLNRTLAGFWRNPTAETVSHSSLLAPIASTLRQQLDSAIEGAQGPGYQVLKNQYGALRSVEKDVAGAVQREANKIPGGLMGHLADLGSAEEFIRGVMTLNPSAMARAGGIKAAKLAMKYVNDPNRAIARLFARRTAPTVGPVRQAVGGTIRGGAAPVGGVSGSELLRQSVVGP